MSPILHLSTLSISMFPHAMEGIDPLFLEVSAFVTPQSVFVLMPYLF